MSDDELQENVQETSSDISYEEALPSYLTANQLTLADFKKHVSGVLLSMVLHVVILIICATAVVQEPPAKEAEEIVVEMKEVDPTPPPPPPPPPEMPEEVTDVVEPLDVPMERPTISNTQAVSLAPSPTSASASVANVSTAGAIGDVTMTSVDLSAPVSNSALKISGLYAARGGGQRMSFVKKYGGSAATEAAVMKALKWLVTQQNEDGSWGDENPVFYYHRETLTCMALLAMLAHGETPQSAEFGESLLKGLKLVTAWVDGTARSRPDPKDLPGVHIQNFWDDPWAVARAGIVLAEGYAITRIPTLERGMNKIVTHFVKRMNPIGGFHQGRRYNKETKEWYPVYGSDFDLNHRIYNALYSAFAAGCEVQGLPEAVDKALSCMEDIHCAADGGFHRRELRRKKGTKGTFEDTAAGTLYIYLMGGGESKAAKTGLTWLENYRPQNRENSELKMDWKNLPGEMSILGWYYMTQALFQGYAGGTLSREAKSNWTKWNRSMIQTLTREQHASGYWPCPADKYPNMVEVIDKETGKRHKEEKVMKESSFGGFSEHNGKLWATVYFTMSLEVYYRYLPTFTVGKVKPANKEAMEAAKAKAEAEEEDLSLD